MKKLFTVVFTMLLAGSLAFAQATSSSEGKTTPPQEGGKKATKTSKAHKGGKKGKKGAASTSSGSTTQK